MSRDTTADDSRLTRRQRHVAILVAVVCIVAVPVGLTASPVAAQDGVSTSELVYVATDSGVTAYHSDTLEEVWSVSRDSPRQVDVARDGSRLFVTHNNGSVEALDPATGDSEWLEDNAVAEPPDDLDHITPGLAGEYLYVQYNSTSVVELEQDTGMQNRIIDVGMDPEMISYANRTDVLYISSGSTAIAYDIDQDTQLWSQDLFTTQEDLTTVQEFDNLVSVGASENSIQYIDGEGDGFLSQSNTLSTSHTAIHHPDSYLITQEDGNLLTSRNTTSTNYDTGSAAWSTATPSTTIDLSLSHDRERALALQSDTLSEVSVSQTDATVVQNLPITNGRSIASVGDYSGEVNDTTVPGTGINLSVNGYQRPGTSQHYEVERQGQDISDNATVTSSDNDTLTVYPSNGTLISTDNASALPAEVTITAEYQNLTDSKNVTIAQPSVENLDLLPPWWKVNATVGDGMMLWLIVATLAAVVATRAATSFAGVGAYVMFMVAGWMTGSVSDGVMVAAILTGLFLGMNLAANVDTTIRGSG